MRSTTEDAFQELYNAYYADLYRYVYHSIKHRSDVEDVVQEVFLQAYRSFSTFRGECGYKTWLFAIAHNHLNSMWRRLFRRKKIMEQYEQELRAEALVEDDVAWKRMLLQQELREALTAIPDHYRDVIVLRYIHDFSVADTGTILRMSESKVRMLTHRALLKLREVWDKGGELYARTSPIT